jgi:hypothetical protein
MELQVKPDWEAIFKYPIHEQAGIQGAIRCVALRAGTVREGG